jgi:hypothetical protein
MVFATIIISSIYALRAIPKKGCDDIEMNKMGENPPVEG